MTRALVLGGGGVTGIGWEVGVLTALARAGVDVTDADFVIGTSAGSVVGVQVTSGRPLEEWYDGQLAPADGEIGAHFGAATMVRMALSFIVPGSPTAKRRRIGRAALRAHPEPADARLDVIRSRIGPAAWPEQDLRITAVEVETGRSRVFTRADGVDLVHAVAASCAVPLVWPPVPIDGRRYVDGGMRSAVNADLATGADRVVVLAPLARSYSRYTSIPAQLARLGDGVRSAVVSPDAEALAMIGKDMLSAAKRADAARTGLRQGALVAEDVRRVWEG